MALNRCVQSVLFLSLFFLTIGSLFEYVSADNCQNCTKFDRSSVLLSRKRRFLLFRKGANVLVTAAIAKALVFTYPKGFNVFIELDNFFPLPWEVQHKIRPLVFAKPPPPPPPKPPTAPKLIEHPGEIWVPPAGWVEGGPKLQRKSWTKDQTYNENPLWRRKDNFSPRNPQMRYNKKYYDKKEWLIPRGRSLEEDTKPVYNSTIEDHQDWEHYQSHRDRRAIYEKFENTLPGTSMVRSCLLRMMCEAKHYLMPRGYSFMHDLFSLLFTIPINEYMDDDYSNVMRSQKDDCENVYNKDCPLSILEFLMNNGKIY